MLTTPTSAATQANTPARHQKRTKLRKAITIAGICLSGLVLIVVLSVVFLFGKEISTLLTVARIGDTDLFTMEYKGDYSFSAFLEQGASSDAEVVSFVSKQLLKGLPLKFDLPNLGCSTFLAVTPDKDYLFGRNFDNRYTPILLVTTHPDDGYASLSVVNLSYVGFNENHLPIKLSDRFLTLAAPYAPMDGINEKGVSIAVLKLSTEPTRQDTDKPDITTSTAIRLVLDRAADVDEAVELLQRYDMVSSAGASYHFQITDASGKSVVVEYADHIMTVLDASCATNFILTPGAWYNHGNGQDRYAIVAETLENTDGVLTEQQAMELLASVMQDADKRSPTQWSVVYNNTKRTLRFCLRGNYDTVYDFAL